MRGEEDDANVGNGLGGGVVEAVILEHHVVETLIVGDKDEGVEVFEHCRLAGLRSEEAVAGTMLG